MTKRYCAKRQVRFQYCSYCSSCDIVTAKHLPICLQVAVTCPNNCKKEGLKREQLQAHIDECSLQVISCPFTSAGCTVKLPWNEMEKHEDTAMRQHLLLWWNKFSKSSSIMSLSYNLSCCRCLVFLTTNNKSTQSNCCLASIGPNLNWMRLLIIG